MTDLEFNIVSVKRLSKGEKKIPGFANVISNVAYFAMPAVFQVLLNTLPRFLATQACFAFRKKAIAALIAAQTWLHYRGAVL
jgi:hypothetical protein